MDIEKLEYAMDFIRFLQVALMGTVGSLVVIFLMGYLILAYGGLEESDQKAVRIGRNWFAALAVMGFVWFAASSASINEAPRSAIDRSIANERADDLQRNSAPKEEGK